MPGPVPPPQLRMLRELVAQLQGEVRRLHARLSEVEPERRNAEQRLRNAAKLQRQTMQEEIDTLKGKLTRAKAEAIAFPKRIEELSKASAELRSMHPQAPRVFGSHARCPGRFPRRLWPRRTRTWSWRRPGCWP